MKKLNKFDTEIKKLIPPLRKNWNWGKSQRGYVKQFSSYFIEYIFPYLLKSARNHGISLEKLSILDVGCGWAPLAIPFTIYEQSSNGGGNRYLGIDIREDAIEWLQRAYSSYDFVSFQLHAASQEADYIGAEHSKTKTCAESDGVEAKFSIPSDFCANIQWSSSVFTHLTPQACLQALISIKGSCHSSGIQINTWLIIDDESKYSLAAQIADRQLPFDCGDFLTYSEENPLVCTAYKIECIERMYKDAGLEILKIDRGSWRGPTYQNNPKHYQDIIISRIQD
ncbi:class I SAM-dependent methyltransferase [Polynucleobacter sp. MWH-UH19D]|uniref:class I SAM-dependent methyltransferase n=1 Tax=Polynucleobacter sp. MWH-UH19D TaxID=1855610 RepID=UPI003364F55C